MSATPHTNAERIAALMRFGYTGAESEFLCLAALHGGYFLRRQFSGFLGRKDGALVTHLAQKALDLGHATSSTWRQNLQVYHLSARPFYQAIGEPENRNRRIHERDVVKNRVMGLDFVLDHREGCYLATEQEKFAYFTGTLQLDPAVLPAKVYASKDGGQTTPRYFLDKYPLRLIGASDHTASRIAFTFVDEGLVSLSRFETYLAQYRRLFAALTTFELVYVAARVRHFAGARAKFERGWSADVDNPSQKEGAETEALLAYFKARRLYETQQFDAFDRAGLIRLRDARERFTGPQNEALYRIWQASGDAALRPEHAPKRAVAPPVQGRFSTYLLDQDYACFGDVLLP